MYYGEIINTDLCNGEGIRTTLFVSGCTLNCEGCFNKKSQNFRYGREYTKETEEFLLGLIGRKNCSGLSICGGDPFEKQNQKTVLELVRKVREVFEDSKTIWLWTGRTYDEAVQDETNKKIIDLIDILIDGRYCKELADKSLPWRGSSNQKIIHLTPVK
jgi:anaerobic ribonucleoside-triphosphate reductase activating protein